MADGPSRDEAVVLLGHGSHLSPRSSEPVHALAELLRRRDPRAEVVAGFWKEEPSLRDVLDCVEPSRAVVVPVFTSDGYFTRVVLPRELGLGRIAPLPHVDREPASSPTPRKEHRGGPLVAPIGERIVAYCGPVGSHPRMAELVLRRAREALEGETRPVDLVVLGHGTERVRSSGSATWAVVRALTPTGEFREVHGAFLDQEPTLDRVLAELSGHPVVVVPFFVAEGWHAGETIPAELARGGPGEGSLVHYAAPVGTAPELIEVVEARIEEGRRALRHLGPARAVGTTHPSTARARRAFVDWVGGGGAEGRGFLEVRIFERGNGGYDLRHRSDADADAHSLRDLDGPRGLRELATYDAEGEYRPLHTLAGLRRGWIARPADASSLVEAIEALYPAALVHWHRGQRSREALPIPVHFEEFAARQTGIYAGVGGLDEEAVEKVAATLCEGGCLRRRCWSYSPSSAARGPAALLDPAEVPCLEPCSLFLARAHEELARADKRATPTHNSDKARTAGRAKPAAAGKVWLVGAGPGDPELITRRGAAVLERAQVVLHDALIHPALLDLAPPDALRIHVGKRGGRRSTRQAKIEGLLVEHARAGKRVVRLKGGDPFIFGRGGEEALFLAEKGIPFEVVPGVSAGPAAAAAAGIPATHRGVASSLTLVTGQAAEGEETPSPGAASKGEGEALEADPDAESHTHTGTTIVYMGVRRLDAITETLARRPYGPETPAAFVEWGTLPTQRALYAPLSGIAERVLEEGLGSPGVLVVGDAVGLGERIAPRERLSLAGRRIVVARTRPHPSRIADELRRRGADPIELPVLRARPAAEPSTLDRALERLPPGGWLLLTARVAVQRLLQDLATTGRDLRDLHRWRIAAFGSETMAELRRSGLRPEVGRPGYRPERAVAALAEWGGEESSRPRHILLLDREGNRSAIAPALATAGWCVSRVDLYRAEIDESTTRHGLRWIAEGVDALLLPSSSSVESIAPLLPEVHARMIAAMGARTAETARAAGLRVDVVGADGTPAGLLAALEERLGPRHRGEKG